MFKCPNVGCSNHGKAIHISKVRYVFDDVLKKLVPNPPIICDNCGWVLEEEKEVKEGFPEIMKFGSMNEADKKAVIKKRANAHFQKVGRHEKEFRKQQAIKKLMNGI